MNNEEKPETTIGQTKRWRQSLDAIVQEMKSLDKPAGELTTPDEIEARMLARIRLIESIMWCGMILKAVGNPNPYPQSYNPASPVVEPTADGLKL